MTVYQLSSALTDWQKRYDNEASHLLQVPVVFRLVSLQCFCCLLLFSFWYWKLGGTVKITRQSTHKWASLIWLPWLSWINCITCVTCIILDLLNIWKTVNYCLIDSLSGNLKSEMLDFEKNLIELPIFTRGFPCVTLTKIYDSVWDFNQVHHSPTALYQLTC